MRVKLTIHGGLDALEIRPLVEYAATHFPHVSGLKSIRVSKNRSTYRGVASLGGSWAKLWINPDTLAFPRIDGNDGRMNYFRHIGRDVKPLYLGDWKQALVAIAAHEMEHLSRRTKHMRRSRQEVTAWNRSVEVVEAYRSEAGQAWVAARKAELFQTQSIDRGM